MRSSMLYHAGCEDHHKPHFLEACSLCSKPLGPNKDIFMYRGNTPFCSKECRQEQIEMDEAQEKKRWKLYRKSETSNYSASSKSAGSGTVQVA